MAITNFTGDVFKSNAPVIAHQVNCKGVMGSGIALQVRQRYPNVFHTYRARCRGEGPAALLGSIQPCRCGGAMERWIVNCFAQESYGVGVCHTNYTAFKLCFQRLHCWAQANGIKKIAIPYRIGCDRAGGDWGIVHKILREIFGESNIDLEIWRL